MRKLTVSIANLFFATNCFAAIELSDSLVLSGFGSTSISKSDNDTPLIINRSIADDVCWDCDTTLGLQLDYFKEDFRASTQLVKRPQDEWSDPELEWAYLGYAIDDIELRGGRLRLPVFLASEYYYVGHAYIFARPPEELYNSILGITAYNGFNLVWQYEIADEYQLTFTPFIGFDDDSTVDVTSTLDVQIDIDKMSGASAQIHGDYFRWNFAYFHADFMQTFEFTNAFPGVPYTELALPKEDIELYSFGAEYELGNWILNAERQMSNIRSTWYASAAYRIGKFVPYALYGENYAKVTNVSTYNGKSGRSWNLGVRYDLRYNISVNLEWQTFDALGGQRGSFVEAPTDDDADLVTLMVSFVF
ncbi:hypothetical protein ACFSJY_03715 [Thalassotalea euphylliae]|uniref:hypothetical protein n=1 Tax=Thalassotalea euphylliae TaxID=1655234 RepID=UPI00362B9F36